MPPALPVDRPNLLEWLAKLVLFIVVVVLAQKQPDPQFLHGLLAGWVLALWQRHPYRAWGLLPWGWFWWSLGLAAEAIAVPPPYGHFALGLGLAGLSWPGLVSTWSAGGRFTPWERRRGTFAVGLLMLLVVLLGLYGNVLQHWPTEALLLAAVSLGVVSLVVFIRPFLENAMELILLPVYRVQALGPGARQTPTSGPVVVIGNHSAFFDPCFIAKHLPRPVTPMMTSVYYDLPILRELMIYVVRAIRVPWEPHRKTTPEIDEAIARLRDGECVLLFPEGGLRRDDDKLLKYFAQGIWHILKAVPETPVVCCWIDGAWGSYFSYGGGTPPGQGKPLDWWRRIRVVFAEPQRLSPEQLATHHATRRYLTQRVFDLRQTLPDLPPGPPPPQLLNDANAHPKGD